MFSFPLYYIFSRFYFFYFIFFAELINSNWGISPHFLLKTKLYNNDKLELGPVLSLMWCLVDKIFLRAENMAKKIRFYFTLLYLTLQWWFMFYLLWLIEILNSGKTNNFLGRCKYMHGTLNNIFDLSSFCIFYFNKAVWIMIYAWMINPFRANVTLYFNATRYLFTIPQHLLESHGKKGNQCHVKHSRIQIENKNCFLKAFWKVFRKPLINRDIRNTILNVVETLFL